MEKKKSSKKTIAVLVIAVVFVAALLLTAGYFYLNRESKINDEAFIEQAVAYISEDYETYRKSVSPFNTEMNMRNVSLWGIDGSAKYHFGYGNTYVASLKWTSKSGNDADFQTLLDGISELYGSDPILSEDKLSYYWEFEEGAYPFAKVVLSRTADSIKIEWKSENPAYEIDETIESIGEVHIDTGKILYDLQNTYDAMTDEQKAYVKNYGKMEELFTLYDEAFSEEFDAKVNELAASATAADYDELIYLRNEYDRMDEQYKTGIQSYDKIDDALQQCAEGKRTEVVKELEEIRLTLHNESSSQIYELLCRYCGLLHSEDIEKYLSYAVYDEIVDDAEIALKASLKKPETYVRKDYQIRNYAYYTDNGTYEIKADIDYSAQTASGKTVDNDRTIYCYYTIDENGITFYDSELSSMDVWEINHL